MSLAIDAVSAGYGAGDVVRGIDLVVPRGSAAAVVGPNGAGKTTLLRVCAGQLHASHGAVSLDGVDLSGLAPSDRARLGMCFIPEGRAVFPSLTVAENVRLLAGDRPADDALEAALEAFPALSRKLAQPAGTLSGGEQQMVALSRAYVTNPAYVLLDEVSMGLAPKIVEQIFEFLGRLRSKGVSLLIVEQYVSMALELADLAYVLVGGRIEFAGEPAELDADQLAASYLGVAT